MDAWVCVRACACVCVCAGQTALAGFLLESPGQKTHESAASRIYSQLIKLAFVLLLGQQPVSINIHRNTDMHTHTHTQTHTRKQGHTYMYDWTGHRRKNLCVRACSLIRIFRAPRACVSKYVEQCVPDTGHTHTHTQAKQH